MRIRNGTFVKKLKLAESRTQGKLWRTPVPVKHKVQQVMTHWKVTSEASTKGCSQVVLQGSAQPLWATVSLELVPVLNSSQRYQTPENLRRS